MYDIIRNDKTQKMLRRGKVGQIRTDVVLLTHMKPNTESAYSIAKTMI